MFEFAPGPDGGVTLKVDDHDGRPVVSLGLRHQEALHAAASILGAAGVTRITFDDGRLHEGAQ